MIDKVTSKTTRIGKDTETERHKEEPEEEQ